jgi:hypothetical protein
LEVRSHEKKHTLLKRLRTPALDGHTRRPAERHSPSHHDAEGPHGGAHQDG